MTETFLFRAVPPRCDRSDTGGDAARRHHRRNQHHHRLRFHGSGGGYFTHDDLQWSNLAGSGLEGDSRLQGSVFGRHGYPNPLYFAMDSGFDYLNVLPDGYSITEERFENLWNVDLRVAKNVSFGDDVRVTFTAELFNALNSNTMLRQTRDVLSDQFGRVDEILAPRIARFGVRVSF